MNITTADLRLEAKADKLLIEVGAIKKEQGQKSDAEIFTERQIKDKCGRDWHPLWDMLCAVKEETEYITLSDIDNLSRLCGLSDRQAAIVKLWMRGLSQKEIAESLNESKQYVSYSLKSSARKILDAWQENPYYGLWEVYFELTKK